MGTVTNSNLSGPTLEVFSVGVLAAIDVDSTSMWALLAGWLTLMLVALTAAAETALQQTSLFRLRKLLSGSEARPEQPWSEQNHTRLLIALQVAHIVLLLNLGGLMVTVLTPLVEEIWQFTAGLAGIMSLVLALEIVARSYARVHSGWMARSVLPLGLTFIKIMNPLFSVLFFLIRPLGPESRTSLADDLEELSEEIRQLQQKGVLEQDQGQILQSAFQFGETIAREVMIPRVDMVCVEMGSPLHQVLDLMIQCGYTRLPVYEETVDNIQGLVHAKDLLRKMGAPNASEVRQLPIQRGDLREILIVPATKKIAKVLRELQTRQITMAIAVDEYGGTDGLLTLEDIVEEIVGEITDEYDQAHEGIQLLKDGSSIVDARIVIEDVNEFLRLELPYDEHETLGGYVYGLFGRVPQAGESLIEGHLQFTIDSLHKQRIKRVRIQKVDPPAADASDETLAAATS